VDAGQPTWYGTVEIGFGVVTALVAIGLAKGSGLARLLVTALSPWRGRPCCVPRPAAGRSPS
jgi:hypothetical protein